MNKIGAHVSGGQNLDSTRKDILGHELEAAQIFLAGPTSWAVNPGDEQHDREFAAWAEEREIPVFVHGPYLMNFGSPKDENQLKSAETLLACLRRAKNIGAQGVVLHSGSATTETKDHGYEMVRRSLTPVLDAALAEGLPPVLLEPMAGQGQTLASTLDSIPGYFDAVDGHSHLGVCLDTAHLLAAGEDIDLPGGTTALLDKFGLTVGFSRLKLIHSNDSKAPKGSKKDRHENLGLGTAGLDLWKEIFAHPGVVAPLVLETPGGGYSNDLKTLRELRGPLLPS